MVNYSGRTWTLAKLKKEVEDRGLGLPNNKTKAYYIERLYQDDTSESTHGQASNARDVSATSLQFGKIPSDLLTSEQLQEFEEAAKEEYFQLHFAEV